MTSLPVDHSERVQRAHLSLEGLSVGDAMGQQFFTRFNDYLLEQRALPASPWRYTDDTVMAMAIIEVLAQHGQIDQDNLAQRFATRFDEDPDRGYGGTAMRILYEIHGGIPWREAAGRAFSGQGSMGNGGAMRAAPIGAYFADDLDAAAENAHLSAEVTHAHPDGQAGAVAVAVAAAMAWRSRATPGRAASPEFFAAVLDHTPDTLTRSGVVTASELSLDASVDTAIHTLGNGSRVVAYDTVPFALWCAARYLHNYPEALWATFEGGGDLDTNGAIVGGIVAMATGEAAIPPEWVRARERLRLREGGAT